MSVTNTVVSKIWKSKTAQVVWELHDWHECHRFLSAHYSATLTIDDNVVLRFFLVPLQKIDTLTNDNQLKTDWYSLWVEVLSPQKRLYFTVKAGIKRYYPEARFESHFHYPLEAEGNQMVYMEDGNTSDKNARKMLVVEEFIGNRKIMANLYSHGSHKNGGHEDAVRLDLEITVTLWILPPSEPQCVQQFAYCCGANEKCLKEKDENLENLSQDLNKLRLGSGPNQHFDVELKTKTGSIQAHRLILSARSSVYRAMFSSAMKEAASREVDIADVGLEALSILVHYMYTGKVKAEWEQNFAELVYAACKYDVQKLVEYLDKNLETICNEGNVKEIYQIAKLHNLTQAMEYAEEYAKKNLIAVLLTN